MLFRVGFLLLLSAFSALADTCPETLKRAAIYTGSFDPLHYGHIEAVTESLADPSLKIETVVVIPDGKPNRFKPNRTPLEIRRAAAAKTFESNPKVVVSNEDAAATVARLRAENPGVEIFGILGSDNVLRYQSRK